MCIQYDQTQMSLSSEAPAYLTNPWAAARVHQAIVIFELNLHLLEFRWPHVVERWVYASALTFQTF